MTKTVDITERRLFYPARWEDDYKKLGKVEEWSRTYPALFEVMLNNPAHPGKLSSRLGTLDLFAQYALQYLLRESEGVESITWYKIANESQTATDRERTDAHWATMKRVMGEPAFAALQDAAHQAGFGPTEGEPDLFCWSPEGDWFFAEAKRSDSVGASQLRWFEVCRRALGHDVDLRVYRIVRAT